MRATTPAALFAACVVVAWSSPARADVSSWLYTGLGPSWVNDRDRGGEAQPTLQLETGLGSNPSGTLIFGPSLRLQTHFGAGTEVGFLFRGLSHGFVNGGWGAGLGLGLYRRPWGVGSTGFLGSLELGAPWGVTASLGAGTGSNDGRHVSFTMGIDLLRLTVYRRSGANWWENPFPAYRPDAY